jgi:hypothetical protein
MKMKISKDIRSDIFDAIRLSGVHWSGHLDESEFLSRIFDLRNLPSHDSRFSDAAGDIWQHRVNNYDWEDDWVFSDGRFDLNSCDDEILLRFLCETIHPVVRPDPQDAHQLLQFYNDLLAQAGFEIIERSRIAGRPVFSARLKVSGPPPSVKMAKDELSFDATYISQQITRLEAAIPHDPDLAIGTAKELVESCCKTILTERGISFSQNLDLSQLVKTTYKELKLTRDDISDTAKAAESIKRLLSNLATVTQGLAELRNLYGTGHGKPASTKGLQPRHAKLAAGAATTLTIFLFETHQERE